jgi:outer membrane protein assembly factor BamB
VQTPSGGINLKKQPPPKPKATQRPIVKATPKPIIKPTPKPIIKPTPKPTPKPYVVPRVPLVLASPTDKSKPPASVVSNVKTTRVFKKPRLLWKTFVGSCDATATATPEGIVVCTGNQIQLLDRNGRAIWAREIGPTHGVATLINNNSNALYVGTEAGVVFAIDRKSSKVLWQQPTAQGAIRHAPLVTEKHIIVESFDNTVYALDRATGNLVWKYERKEGSFGYAAPVLINRGDDLINTEDDMILLVCGDSTLYGLDIATGGEMWRVNFSGRSLTTPAIAGKKLFVAGDGVMPQSLAIEKQKGKRLWEASGIKSGWFGPCTLLDNTLYVANDQRYVYAINASNGQMRWQYRLLGGSQSRPVVDRETNTLYVGSVTFRDNPTLTALDATNGNKLWEYKVGYLSASPLIDNGVLYIGSTNGNFYAFGLY